MPRRRDDGDRRRRLSNAAVTILDGETDRVDAGRRVGVARLQPALHAAKGIRKGIERLRDGSIAPFDRGRLVIGMASIGEGDADIVLLDGLVSRR